MVFIPYTEHSRFPQCFLTGHAWHVRVWPLSFLAVEPRWDPLHSLAWNLQQVYAAIDCALLYTTNMVAVHIIPFSTQSAACLQLPAQMLQVCLAVITSLLGCILFLIFVTWDLSSCQLVAPLLQNKEAKPRQHCGNSFILVLLVLPSYSCAHPVCFWMEAQDSLSQCKVLSRSGKWINKLRDARNKCLKCSSGKDSPFCQRLKVNKFIVC